MAIDRRPQKKSAESERVWKCHFPNFDADKLDPDLQFASWNGHRDFGYDLVVFMRPKRIVEIGSQYGGSFFAFAQAIRDFQIDCEMTAIDNWVGNDHDGFYDEGVFETFQKVRDSVFSDLNIQTLRMQFEQAFHQFPAGSVDLLHIDGCHDYESVRCDFETWSETLAKDAVVLFHDIQQTSGMGSAKYWTELTEKFPFLEFPNHSWGLGILFPNGAYWRKEMLKSLPGNWVDLYENRAGFKLKAAQLAVAEDTLVKRWAIIDEMKQAKIALEVSLRSAQTQLSLAQNALKVGSQENKKLALQIQQFQNQLVETKKVQLDLKEKIERYEQADLENKNEIDLLTTAHRESYSALIRGTSPRSAVLAISSVDPPFSDLAFTLYLFISKLHRDAVRNKDIKLFFLSREGFLLKKLFEIYQKLNSIEPQVETAYLQASRKSTFLASLRAISEESFETLFRQYKTMSCHEFLSSLALETHADALAQTIGLSVGEFRAAQPHFPTSEHFERLRNCSLFVSLYESERQKSATGLTEYLSSLGVDDFRRCIALVDVGWKGSIQDNLFNFLSARAHGQVHVRGYYVGLLAPGLIAINNEKNGLLFDLAKPQKASGIYSENCSLYETLLYAEHGSPRSYSINEKGDAIVWHDEFDVDENTLRLVEPVTKAMVDKFVSIAANLSAAEIDEADLEFAVSSLHKRMVFHPTTDEITWIESITHAENFGVFEKSKFSVSNPKNILERILFTIDYLRGKSGYLGFWPYLTILRKALPGVARLYARSKSE